MTGPPVSLQRSHVHVGFPLTNWCWQWSPWTEWPRFTGSQYDPPTGRLPHFYSNLSIYGHFSLSQNSMSRCFLSLNSLLYLPLLCKIDICAQAMWTGIRCLWLGRKGSQQWTWACTLHSSNHHNHICGKHDKWSFAANHSNKQQHKNSLSFRRCCCCCLIPSCSSKHCWSRFTDALQCVCLPASACLIVVRTIARQFLNVSYIQCLCQQWNCYTRMRAWQCVRVCVGDTF